MLAFGLTPACARLSRPAPVLRPPFPTILPVSCRDMSNAPSPRKGAPLRAPKPATAPEGDALDRMRVKAARIEAALKEVYPQAPRGFLDHKDAFTLLTAVVLSAQTTDKSVNKVTPALWKAAPNPKAMRALGVERVLKLIRTVGLAPGKARSLVGLSGVIEDVHGGEVPSTMEELTRLPGVGRKTASVVLMQAFNVPAFPVDTHIHRLACRWGCGHPKSIDKTEASLMMWFPDETSWADLHTRIILFGREHCPARKHDMDACPICSFAATPEARAMNKSYPDKFVGVAKHKDPYALREPRKVKPSRASKDGLHDAFLNATEAVAAVEHDFKEIKEETKGRAISKKRGAQGRNPKKAIAKKVKKETAPETTPKIEDRSALVDTPGPPRRSSRLSRKT